MRHDGALVCTEREAPCNLPVCQGVGKELQTAVGGGSVGEFGEGLPGQRVTVGDRDVV